jgi:hypothetical protein
LLAGLVVRRLRLQNQNAIKDVVLKNQRLIAQPELIDLMELRFVYLVLVQQLPNVTKAANLLNALLGINFLHSNACHVRPANGHQAEQVKVASLA